MTARPRISKQLADLIQAQTRDDACDRLWPDAHAIREADVATPGSDEGFSLDSLADSRSAPPDARLIAEEDYTRRGEAQMAPPIRIVGDGRVWTRDIIRFETSAKCPVCSGKPLKKPLCCLCCHQSAYDPKPWPMQESTAQATKREKALAGGTGIRKGLPGKRGRKALWADYVPTGKVAP